MNKTGMLAFATAIQHFTGRSSQKIGQEKNKVNQIGKDENYLYLKI